MIKWSHPGKGVATFPTPRCSSFCEKRASGSPSTMIVNHNICHTKFVKVIEKLILFIPFNFFIHEFRAVQIKTNKIQTNKKKKEKEKKKIKNENKN